MLDNYLNTVTFEERELLKAQLTKLAGVDEKGNITKNVSNGKILVNV